MFDQVPVVIFDIIHSYLSHYNYRQLLNTNHSVFADVKYETVYYNLKQFDKLAGNPIDLSDRKTQLVPVLQRIMRNVKSKQKQVSIYWLCGSLKAFSAFCRYYSGIHSLDMYFTGRANLPLHMFSTIANLTLTGLSNESLEGLAGEKQRGFKSPCTTNVLTLRDCSNINDISEISKISTLKKVTISGCGNLRDLSCLVNTEDVVFNTRSEIVTSVLFYFRHLRSLYLVGEFLPSCNFLTAFGEVQNENDVNRHCRIQNLWITSRNSHPSFVHVFPQWPDLISIELDRFDISSWNELMSSLSMVSLRLCILPSNLSCFQLVSELSLNSVDICALDFTIFQNLKLLELTACCQLATLIIGTNIKHIEVVCAYSLLSISNIGIVKFLTIGHCPLLTELRDLVKVNSMKMYSLKSLSDFSFLKCVLSKVIIKNCPRFVKNNNISILEGIPDVQV
jgi:hypothetical protein